MHWQGEKLVEWEAEVVTAWLDPFSPDWLRNPLFIGHSFEEE